MGTYMGGTTQDDGYGIATDNSGNVYVTGFFQGTNVNFNPGGSDLYSSNGSSDVFLSKFNSSGTFQWARTWGGTSGDQSYDVAVDSSGNVYVTGIYYGTNVNLNPDGLDLHSSNGSWDVFLSKFNSSGAFQWALTWGGTSSDFGYGAATDSSGNVYVTGFFEGTDVNFNPAGSDLHSSNGSTDAFLSKFMPDGYW